MIKIEALIHPFKLDEARSALEALDILEITTSEVSDYGTIGKLSYRGAEYRAAAPRIKLEMLVSEDHAEEVISAVRRAARTHVSGDRDGRILVYEVADAIRIHSGAHVQYSLP